ncbi:MAG: AMP-binding protein [Bacteroidetes bacterium]|jgi:O-succinylbenzoic acid--CoA ligase|nr:AMP-binding protein [Bacteroidota bacterium]
MELINRCSLPEETQKLDQFIRALDQGDSIEIKSSGSTGTPKVLIFSQQEIQQSAQMTIARFGLSQKDCLLCPFSMDYVAGKMMVARAYFSGARLLFTGPTRSPYESIENHQPSFSALVPYQLVHTLQSAHATHRINQTAHVLIGGAPLPPALQKDIKEKVTCSVYQTFGMAETLSHVALRSLRFHASSSLYLPLPGVMFSATEEGCLMVCSPINKEWMVTNDIVRMEGDGFQWLGRKDWAINSGGHKLHPEELEQKLAHFFGPTGAVAVGRNHATLGQALHLVVTAPFSVSSFIQWASNTLHPYEIPKTWSLIDSLPLLASGKLDRLRLKRAIDQDEIEYHYFKN